MCGIYGILTLDGAQQRDRGTLRAMGDVIVHRGPDDEGAYADPHMLLGMRRLSIIDVAGGHQPITNEDGSVVVVCNGEIYNYRQLRERLIKAGHRFATHSDTEVIAHLYEERGEEFLTELRNINSAFEYRELHDLLPASLPSQDGLFNIKKNNGTDPDMWKRLYYVPMA